MSTWLDFASQSHTSGDNLDGGNFTDYSSGDSVDGGNFDNMGRYHHIFDFGNIPTIGVDDIVITGIKVENSDDDNPLTAMFGSDGYVLSIINNSLIQTQAQATTIANSIGAKIVGMRFRQFSANVLSDPCIEAGDPVYVSVRTNNGYNTYQSYITGLSYRVNSREMLRCDAETPSRNSSVRYSAQTKTIVKSRQVAKQEISAYDLQVQQLTNLIAYGYGMHKSGELQEDGSTKYYMHNKPTIAESSVVWTLTDSGLAISTDHGITWGVDNNGNMLVNVLTAIGINAEWITTGEISGIKITMEEGKIGPFTLNSEGLFSKTMQMYESGNYPLIWLTKPDTNLTEDTNGYVFGGEGSARANYEPSVAMVRSIEDGIETDVYMMARHNPGLNKSGTIEIERFEVSTGNLVSRVTITEDGYAQIKYENGNLSKQVLLNPHQFNMWDYSADTMFGVGLDSSSGNSFIMSSGQLSIQAPDGVFVNGKQL